MGETHQHLTFDHIIQGVIRNISIEASAWNQTAFVYQGLVSNTALHLRATDGGHLQNNNSYTVKFIPDFYPGQSEEPMGYICTSLELDPRTSVPDSFLCCELDIASVGQEVAENLQYQSFSLGQSFHKIQVLMFCNVQVCGCRP